jgi:sec-independent protein translocase protein TatA
MGLGIPELLVIFGIALLIFGPKKIGELGKGLGDGIRHFKSAMREPASEPVEPLVEEKKS